MNKKPIEKFQQLYSDLKAWNRKHRKSLKSIREQKAMYPFVRNLNEACYLSNYWLTKLLLVKKED